MITTITQGQYMHWYVNVENQAYGPYSDDQMRSFVAEGRITTASLISHSPENGFYGAGEFDEFNLWCGANQEVLQPLMAVGGVINTQGGQNIQTATTPIAQHQETVSQYAPIQPVAQQAVAPSSQIEQQTFVKAGQSQVYLIMAEIHSNGEMAFLQALQSFGQTERVGDTVWLVRSPHSVEQIRNALSQALDQQDRLFILDSKTGKTAWFNIGADLDHRIRELWDEDED